MKIAKKIEKIEKFIKKWLNISTLKIENLYPKISVFFQILTIFIIFSKKYSRFFGFKNVKFYKSNKMRSIILDEIFESKNREKISLSSTKNYRNFDHRKLLKISISGFSSI